MGCCASHKDEGHLNVPDIADPRAKERELLVIRCQAACRRYLDHKKVAAIRKMREGRAIKDINQASGNFVNDVVNDVEEKLGPFDQGHSQDDPNLEYRPEGLLEDGAKYKGQWNKAKN